jgi:uroporphyrinogen-III decarboxylase
VLVEANLVIADDFQLDILQAISDPYCDAADFGLEVELPADNLPINRQPLLQTPDDLKKLVPPNPATGRRMSDRLDAIRLFR